ncbi:hypothetical protein [Streptomyces griseoviridis]|uniref:Uncharacterized protein n=1 Tax=Streptomyces griseoviridis TaxID=45398 RepID=A0ABT9LF83_STRGD|nr:hypothetical protein [Streptomyces griseoviridis]MDP9682382.1 hypothetical protein [Streptomyces griseoviridis]GGS81863.1 hypothetical protein GCM10010240_14040 [Streptomyces griseoviridis]
MSDPIVPSRIIPAGAPLPARPPQPGEVPPWRTPPPPPAAPPWPGFPPPPPPGPIEVHVTLLPLPLPEPEPEPRWWERVWDYVTDRLITWRMTIALALSVTPWVAGQSPVGLWSRTVHAARDEASIGGAYVLAGVAVAAAWALDRHTGRTVPRALLVTASLGATGVVHWWDPILALTGVSR